MAESKPLPRTLEPDDERKIQLFLERASSIVLEQRVLDSRHWRSLVKLAEELELTDTQLRSTVNDLQQRGVIAEIDLSPPKPPPLPAAKNQPPRENQSLPVSEPSVPEENFALTPPPPKPPRSRPVPAKEEIELEEFKRRAAAIIAEHRGFGPRTHALLSVAAQELGLSDAQADEVLQQLQTTAEPSDPAAGEETTSSRRRWRVEGEPEPSLPPPSRGPEETFRDFLRGTFARISEGVVTSPQEEQLIKHGSVVLGLARVFARHLVCEEAERVGLHCESARETEALPRDVTELRKDPRVGTFLERAVPILAQHHGVNAKSRVLLNALAQELGLESEQVDAAIRAAQFRAATSQEQTEARQQERLEGFRGLLHGTLVSLPRKVLTADIERDLARHAEELHGVTPDLARAAIREECLALRIRQISERQAQEHIEQLLDTKLGDAARLTEEVRARIQSEGEQWGLSPEQIKRIIKTHSHAHEQRRRAESRLVNGALWAAGIMAFVVLAFLGWVWFEQSVATSQPPRQDVTHADLARPVDDESPEEASWLSPDLQISVANARADFATLWKPLAQVESSQSNLRRSAYERLVSALTAEHRAEAGQQQLIRVLSGCFAEDPDEASAREILDSLLEVIPDSPNELRADEELYRKVFLATRAAAALVSQSEGERQALAASDLGRAIGHVIHPGTQPGTFEMQCQTAAAQHMYALLAAMAATQPSLVAGVHNVLAAQTVSYLTATQFEKLQTDVLVAILEASPRNWRDFQELIDVTIELGSPLNVLRLLDVYEETTEASLQEFMAQSLLRRARVAPSSREVPVVAREVRKALGVDNVVSGDQRMRMFLERSEQQLAKPRQRSTNMQQLLGELVNLAYLSTLGCALSQGSAGAEAFDALAAQDPNEMLKQALERVADAEISTRVAATDTLLERRLRVLHSRATSVSRSVTFQGLAELASELRVADLTPEQATIVAKYLLMRKGDAEHAKMLEYVPALRAWKSVRLALGDELDKTGIDREQLQELVSKLLGRDYRLGEGEAGREALRVALLRDVWVDANKEAAAGDRRYKALDAATDLLRQYYETQARVLRVDTVEESPTPTVILPRMIEEVAGTLSAARLDDEQRRLLSDIGATLGAIDYASTNDMQRMAQLERVWLQLLAVVTAQRNPGTAKEAALLITDLRDQDRAAAHVVEQLREGQAALLQVWMLRSREK